MLFCEESLQGRVPIGSLKPERSGSLERFHVTTTTVKGRHKLSPQSEPSREVVAAVQVCFAQTPTKRLSGLEEICLCIQIWPKARTDHRRRNRD